MGLVGQASDTFTCCVCLGGHTVPLRYNPVGAHYNRVLGPVLCFLIASLYIISTGISLNAPIHRCDFIAILVMEVTFQICVWTLFMIII